jgi:hypothetical protein
MLSRKNLIWWLTALAVCAPGLAIIAFVFLAAFLGFMPGVGG